MKYAVTGSSFNHAVGYQYNVSNNLLSLVETVNSTELTTSYEYDKNNRVTSVTTVIKIGASSKSVTEAYIYDN